MEATVTSETLVAIQQTAMHPMIVTSTKNILTICVLLSGSVLLTLVVLYPEVK
jgi:hypothetical protein